MYHFRLVSRLLGNVTEKLPVLFVASDVRLYAGGTTRDGKRGGSWRPDRLQVLSSGSNHQIVSCGDPRAPIYFWITTFFSATALQYTHLCVRKRRRCILGSVHFVVSPLREWCAVGGAVLPPSLCVVSVMRSLAYLCSYVIFFMSVAVHGDMYHMCPPD